ncbi:MAG: hypothetical protein H8D78_18430 [Chloroflexi bacterium]|nr:hypothetical protein [Chloroflexota bacterium]
MISRYPQLIQENLRQTADILGEASGLVSVLLLGSAARGELAYADVAGQLQVFSDYELLVVTGRRLPGRERQRIAAQLTELERGFGQRNPLFHLDVIFRERRRLRTLPRIIFTYELKANAQVLRGEDVRHLLPEVTPANLDLRNSNEILLKRLWAILLHTPRRLLRGPLTALEEMVWGYVLCRNALDLTTVLLPHCGVLLPSYGQRVQYLAEHYGQLGLTPRFGEDFPAFLSTCLQERQSLRFSEPLPNRYAKSINYLMEALAFLLDQVNTTTAFREKQEPPPPRGGRTGEGGFDTTRIPPSPYPSLKGRGNTLSSEHLPPDESLAQRLATDSRRLFNERPISPGEWVNLARLTIDYAKDEGPLAAIRWLCAPRKGLATAGLLAAHQALVAHQAGQDDEAARQLAQSARRLARIAVTPLPLLEGDFADRWLTLRRAWGDFWREAVRLGDPKYRQRFDLVMEWEDG